MKEDSNQQLQQSEHENAYIKLVKLVGKAGP